MTIRLGNLILAVAWAALMLTLIGQIRIEALRPQWTSQVPAGMVLLINVTFTLMAVLRAIAASPRQRLFWIGCSVVATALTAGQILDLKPTGIARNMALLVESWILPTAKSGRDMMYRGSHLAQLELVLSYCLVPWLALAGGWYTDCMATRSRQGASPETDRSASPE